MHHRRLRSSGGDKRKLLLTNAQLFGLKSSCLREPKERIDTQALQ